MKKMTSTILKTRRKSYRSNDEGAALLTIILVSFTIFVLATTVFMWTMSSIQTTRMHEAQNNSLNAAEGSRDTALADFSRDGDSCVNRKIVDYHNNNISGEYRVYHLITDSDAEDIPEDVIDENGNPKPGVRFGCPTYSTGDEDKNTFIYIVSEGKDMGITETIVSSYEAQWIGGMGSFAYGVSSFGTFDFEGTSGIYNFGAHNLMVARGELRCTGMSRITGSVHVLDPTSHSNIGNCGIIDGDFITAGNVSMNGGNQGMIVHGDLCVEGRITAMHHSGNLGVQVSGNYQHGGGPGSCPQLSAAKASAWTDYSPDLTGSYVADADMCINRQNYNRSPWYDSKGALIRFIEGRTVDTVIDMTNCAEPLAINGHTAGNVRLRANITLVVDNIATNSDRTANGINSLNLTSADGSFKEFNIIVPDRVTPSQDPARDFPHPHCEGRNINITQLNYDNNTAGFIYSPCGGVTPSRGKFRGVLYLGDNGFRGGGSQFEHVDIGTIPEDSTEYFGLDGVLIPSPTPINHTER